MTNRMCRTQDETRNWPMATDGGDSSSGGAVVVDKGANWVEEGQIRGYDVLLCPPDLTTAAAADGTLKQSKKLQFATADNVGDQRFVIFLGLHQGSYDDASARNDEDAIDTTAAGIVRTVCHECEPKGRFLALVEDNDCEDDHRRPRRYRDLGDGEAARRIVRMALEERPAPAPCRRVTASVSEDDRSYSTADGAARNPAKSAVNLADRRFSVSKIIKNSGVFTYRRRRSSLHRAPCAAAAAADAAPAITPSSSDELKRRRRSSLLRRSACDLSHSIKTACRRRSSAFSGIAGMKAAAASAAESPSRDANVPLTEASITKADVLVAGTGGRGIRTTTNVGNNRFRVMIDMERGRYESFADNDQERKTIVETIVSNVRRPDAEGHPGRFLGEIPDRPGLLQVIPYELAVRTVRHCLETLPGQDGSARSIAFATPHDVTDLRRNAVKEMRKKLQRGGSKGFSSSLRQSQIYKMQNAFRTLGRADSGEVKLEEAPSPLRRSLFPPSRSKSDKAAAA